MNANGTAVTIFVKSIEKFRCLKTSHAQRVSSVEYLFPTVKATMKL